jgi:hypothetical protein
VYQQQLAMTRNLLKGENLIPEIDHSYYIVHSTRLVHDILQNNSITIGKKTGFVDTNCVAVV